MSGAGCGPAGEWRDHVPIRMVTYGWTGWNQSATTWLLMHAAVNVRISQDRSAAGLGVARQEEDCAVSVGGWTVARLYVDKTWARIRQASPGMAVSPSRCPSGPRRSRLRGSGHRPLEIRRATHSLNRSQLVLIASAVYLAATDLPLYLSRRRCEIRTSNQPPPMSAAPAITRAPRSAPVKASSESDVCDGSPGVLPDMFPPPGRSVNSCTRSVADQNVNGVGLRRPCNVGHSER